MSSSQQSGSPEKTQKYSAILTHFFSKFDHRMLLFSNFIPHETITCDDRDPPWFNKKSNPLYMKEIQHLKSFAAIEIIVLQKDN